MCFGCKNQKVQFKYLQQRGGLCHSGLRKSSISLLQDLLLRAVGSPVLLVAAPPSEGSCVAGSTMAPGSLSYTPILLHELRGQSQGSLSSREKGTAVAAASQCPAKGLTLQPATVAEWARL